MSVSELLFGVATSDHQAESLNPLMLTSVMSGRRGQVRLRAAERLTSGTGTPKISSMRVTWAAKSFVSRFRGRAFSQSPRASIHAP